MKKEYSSKMGAATAHFGTLRGTSMWSGRRVQLCAALLLAALLDWRCQERVLAGQDFVATPAFPSPISLNEAQFKITSEVIDELDVAARIQEEYIDLARGKASFVASTSSGHYVRHLDADEGLYITYRPYKCFVKPMGDISFDARLPDVDRIASSDGRQELWNFNIETTVNLWTKSDSLWSVPGETARNQQAGKSRPMRLFGVTGLWLMASQKKRTFMRANIIYSASNDVYRPALVWKVSEGDYEFEFYFMEQQQRAELGKTVRDPQGQPTLEMIKIASKTDRSLVRTINILSIERSLPAAVNDEVLSVPLGYGCFSSLLDAYANDSVDSEFVELVRRRRAYANRHVAGTGATWTGRAELEVTATKAVEPADAAGIARRSSDTFSVELAQTAIKAAQTGGAESQAGPYVKLIRWRNSREDQKLVMNEFMRVKTTIDMLRGTCEETHMPSTDDERVLIKFANGAEFDANIELFNESDDLHFIKVTSSNANKRRLHHYEGTAASKELVGWLKSSTGASDEEVKRTRVVRSYAMDTDSFELASVTIWLLDETESNIRESYQIYVIDLHDEDGTELAETRAKQFDISYECYLENEAKVQNRDFAWFQLSYPASQRILGLVANHPGELKQIYYERYVQDLMRVPRVELLFEEDKFKIRTLILDLPPVELVYDKLAKTQLLAADDHDQVYMEPDLKHCAHLCRINHCSVMSYCWKAHSCTLSTRHMFDFSGTGPAVEMRDKFSFSRNADCDTYTIPARLERGDTHRITRLTSILARLQHQNYAPLEDLPPAPDEITLSQEESGLSSQERQKIQIEYATKVQELLTKENRLPELAFPVELPDNFLFLIPSKFELESDPLTEFGLHDSASEADLEGASGSSSSYDADDDQRVPHFHKGLTMARLNIVQMQNSLRPEDANLHRVAFHSFRGLNYDQCAMACWDSKCGTFSFCDQGGECILSSAKTLGHARALGLVEQAPDCVIAQRDFLGNFVKFPNVYRPQVYKFRSTEPVLDPSECALNCVAETSYRCLSFQFCSKSSTEGKEGGQCYYQASHHSLNEEAPTETGCDHYARSQLADFIRIDARRVASGIVDKLKTSTYTDLSVFGCAERCSNELVDCTAFQFCVHPGGSGDSPARECLTIESRITPSMLKVGDKDVGKEETIVDETNDGGEILQSGDYLSYDVNCQVFSMRKESSQAHLRDLAFGGLIRTSQDKSSEPRQTSGMGILKGLFLYATVVVVTASVTCGTIILASKSELVRQRIERFRIVCGI